MNNINKIFPLLYKKNKNESFQVWKIWTVDETIYTEHGNEDGKKQLATKIAKAKNTGKTNETTPSEQAIFTAQSMWNKKKDKGYFETIDEAKNEVVFLPMLAQDRLKMSEKKVKALFSQPFFVQPKMDGVRCLARWNGDKIQLLSRGGKEYTIPHISSKLEAIIEPGQVLDGEIYIHGLLRQDITALVKKHRNTEYEDTGYSSLDLEYWVYDAFSLSNLKEPFCYRNILLSRLNFDNKMIRHVSTSYIETEKEFKDKHEMYTSEGFEGTIIRLLDGPYELGHRSQSLIKYKDFLDDEFEVIGAQQGEGKFLGCVIWICETKEGKSFHVVPKGTLKQKKEWFKEALNYIGKKITVKYQGLSKDGIPEFPVGLDFRPEEDI